MGEKEQDKRLTKEQLEAMIKNIVGGALAEKIATVREENTQWMKTILSAREEKSKPAGEKGKVFGGIIRALAANKGHRGEAVTWAEKAYGKDHDVVKSLMAGDASAGGFLIQDEQMSEVIELLRPMAVVRRLNPQTVTMTTGSLRLPKITGGATASYVGETQNAPKTQQATGQLVLTFKKLLALVPISNDLLRYATPGSEGIVRDDVLAALAQREDLAFIRDNGSQNTPKGLRYWAPAANVIAANATVNLANITADLAKLVLALEEANVRMIRPAWMFAPRTKQALMTIRDTNGNYAFRDEMLRGAFWGWPFGSSTQIPTNLGGGSNESEVYFQDMADAVIGEAMRISIDASPDAAYDDSGTVRAAFSRDETVIRAIEEHDFGMRHDASVAVLTGVTWAP